ncbi:hypothetical protein [Terrabacter sp. MAHUQ-38]|uniref:hypothetical protein n=1 Tax=unclassified Terrabacter TaxID=2630222 RepID=UPI00165D6F1A|nr:hypothetical protein [Terrabacter sp. MAHUQ-38]MBC9824110.1 hypothetical protein [Terrabacter sp. MAHUQ-38]
MSRWLGAPVQVVDGDARLNLRRVWPREHGVLHLEYAHDSNRVGAQLLPDEHARRRLLRRTPGLDAIEDDDPESRLLVHRAGVDRRLTGLAALVAQPGAHVVSHVPERRGVVRLHDGSYARALRHGRSGQAVASVERARAASGGTFVVPRLLGHDIETSTTVWAPLEGPTLLALATARPSTSVLAAAWRAAGRAVRALHDGDRAGLPHHGPVEELAVTRRWLSAAGAWRLLPPRGDHPAYEELLHGEPGALGLLHRDLHDKQVLVGPQLGLLDLDTLAAGERALDLGNVLAHLDLRCAQGLLDPRSAAVAAEAFLAGAAPDPATTHRIAAYRAVTRLRLTGLYAFRPRWHGLARAWDRELWADTEKASPRHSALS